MPINDVVHAERDARLAAAAGSVVTPDADEKDVATIANECGISVYQAKSILAKAEKADQVEKRTVTVAVDVAGKAVKKTLYKEKSAKSEKKA